MRWLRKLFARKPNARDNLSLIVEATRNSYEVQAFTRNRAAALRGIARKRRGSVA